MLQLAQSSLASQDATGALREKQQAAAEKSSLAGEFDSFLQAKAPCELGEDFPGGGGLLGYWAGCAAVFPQVADSVLQLLSPQGSGASVGARELCVG